MKVNCRSLSCDSAANWCLLCTSVLLGNARQAPLLPAVLALGAGFDPCCLVQEVCVCPKAVRKWQEYILSAPAVFFPFLASPNLFKQKYALELGLLVCVFFFFNSILKM